MKLQPLLTEYLMEHGSLPLPDAGQLSVTHVAAAITEDQKTINPPVELWSFSPDKPSETSLQDLVKFISSRLGISEEQAQNLLNEEGNLLTQFDDQQKLDWAGVGYFQKQTDDKIGFSQGNISSKYLQPVSLQPVPKVQPQEIISEVVEEDQEPFYGFAEPEKKNYWWVWAIVIFVVSAVLVFFRYYLG